MKDYDKRYRQYKCGVGVGVGRRGKLRESVGIEGGGLQ